MDPHQERSRSLTNEPIRIHPHSLTLPRSAPLVSDKLYSGFVEHLGRGIYGGIVDDPKKPSPASILKEQDKGDERTKGRLAWRKDVVKILAKDGELEMPILRWPGGNFVSNYHWQDGIGPISERPKRVELAWLSTETNHFGTDEFIDYCRELKVEPYFCINMGTGTYEEALAWLEYCNGTGDTYWANLHRKNTGRDEPHNVKYWGLGNEMHGPWQVGFLNATDYTKMAKRWAHGMKLVDPTIKLVSCGNQGNSEWDREVLNGLIGVVGFHSIHLYSMLGHEHYSTVQGFDYVIPLLTGMARSTLKVSTSRTSNRTLFTAMIFWQRTRSRSPRWLCLRSRSTAARNGPSKALSQSRSTLSLSSSLRVPFFKLTMTALF